MKILAADDEILALEVLVDAIKDAEPTAEIVSFRSGRDVLDYLSENTCDVCFFDIEMRDMNGIELAYEVKKFNPKANIIFVTGYSDYTQDAFEVRASGYVLKPVTSVKVAEEIRNLRNPIEENQKNFDVYVKTFGNFDVYSKGEPIIFKRSKSKELLAYLIDRKGAGVTKKEIAAILFPGHEYERRVEDYINKIYREMTRSLNEAGIGDIVVKKRNYYAIDPDKVKCDRYDFEKGKSSAIKAYMGEYMQQYMWASFKVAR
ncbi:MAG: response regulator [Lachnospiraceae bacterium]|nr:response regulator [Lachnospiraceae bacterium]